MKEHGFYIGILALLGIVVFMLLLVIRDVKDIRSDIDQLRRELPESANLSIQMGSMWQRIRLLERQSFQTNREEDE